MAAKLQGPACTMTGAHQLLQTFLDQCKTGNFAELRLTCEGGRLKANMFADLGPLRPEVKPKTGDSGSYGGRVSPSRARRREKRASERQLFAMAGETAAEKASEVDQVAAAGNAATEEAFAENAAPWKGSVDYAAAAKAAESDEKNTAAASEMTAMKAAEVLVEKADGRIDTSLRPRTVEDGKLALVCSAKTKCDELSDTETASTSRKLLSPDQNCWNCEAVFTPAHQCNGSSEPVSEGSAPKLPDPTVRTDDPGRTFAPQRGLNIKSSGTELGRSAHVKLCHPSRGQLFVTAPDFCSLLICDTFFPTGF